MQAGQLEVDFTADTKNLEGGMKRASSLIGDFGKNAAMGLAQSAGMSIFGALTGAVKDLGSSMIDSNAQAETLGQSLEVATGSADKAKDVFGQLQAFAAKTPFEFPELIQTAISLESLGTDAMTYMDTIGNTAAATGKSLDQVTQAFLDAQVGEFERLKEFGIRASSEAGKTTLTWMQNGKQMTKTVDTNNQEMIQSTLQAIWNDKYAGAMEKQSTTFMGMFSTLKDNISLTMQAAGKPIFEFAKTGLANANEFFARFNELAESGLSAPEAALQAFTEQITKLFGPQIGSQVKNTFNTIVNAGKAAFSTLKNVVRTVGPMFKTAFDFILKNKDTIIGGLKGIAAGFALLTGGSMVVTALTAIGAGLAAILSPIGLLVGAMALFGVAYQKNIGGFADLVNGAFAAAQEKFEGFMGVIDKFVGSFQNMMDRGINPVDAAIRALRQTIIQNFGADNPIVDFLGNIRNAGANTMQWIQSNLIPTVQNIGKYFQAAAGNGDAFNDWITHVPDGIRPIVRYLGSLVAIVSEVVRGFQEGGLLGAFNALRDNADQVGRSLLLLLGHFKDLALNGVQWAVDYLSKHGPEMMSWLGGVKDEAIRVGGELISNLVAAFQERWPMISSWFTGTFIPGVTEGLASAGAWVQEHGGEFLTNFLTTAQAVWTSNIAPWLQQLPGNVGILLGTLKDTLQPIATEAWENFKTTASTYWDSTIVPWLAGLPDAAGMALATYGPTIASIAGDAFKLFYDNGLLIWNQNVLPFLQNLASLAFEASGAIVTTMGDLGIQALTALYEKGSEIWHSTVVPFLQRLPQAASDTALPLVQNMSDLGFDALNAMGTQIETVWTDTVEPFLSGIPQKAVDAMVEFTTHMAAEGLDGMTALYNNASAVWNDTVVPFFQRIPQAAVDALVGFIENLTTQGRDAITGMYNGLSGAWHDTVIPFFQRIPQAILDALPNPLEWLNSVGADAMQGFINGLESKKTDLWNSVQGVFGQAEPAAKDTLEEKSPSKVFYRVGQDAVAGFNIGVTDATADSLKAIKGWTGDIAALTIAQFNKLSDDARAELFQSGKWKAPKGATVFEDFSVRGRAEQRRIDAGTSKKNYVNPWEPDTSAWENKGIGLGFGPDDVAAKRIQRMLDRGMSPERVNSRITEMFGGSGGQRPEWLNAVMSNASGRAGWDFGEAGPRGYDLRAAQESLKAAQGEFDKRLRENMDKMDETTGKFKAAVDKFGEGENLGTLQAQIVVDSANLGRVVIAETNAKLSRSRDNMSSRTRSQ